MKLVIDESVGISTQIMKEWFDDRASSVFIKEVRVESKTKSTLTPHLKETKAGWFRKSVKTSAYSLQDQVDYFRASVGDEGLIVYFYDEQYTASDDLLRLRNWLLPELSLVLFPVTSLSGPTHVLFLTAELLKHEKELLTHDHVQSFLSNRINEQNMWVITTDVKPFLQKKKRFSIYKKKEVSEYTLTRVSSNSVTTVGKGSINKLVELVIKEGDNWLVAKKEIDETLHLDGKGKQVTLPSHTLPGNVPYIQLVPVEPAKTNIGVDA
ncbi:hypothetical protein [Alteribacter aurantiacus]|uniref:hypothetical protein n=1 Tax=Alteribacter aurantiacus TaxID=254410 RepID=UPI0004178225|nr:hypothetical protein [Alteribacter aurantiacus]